MDKPFTKYVCDVCGKTIDTQDAVLQWVQRPSKEFPNHPSYEELEDIRICCNKEKCDMHLENKASREHLHFMWNHLNYFVEPNNIDDILCFPMERVIPQNMKKDYLKILRRLTIPYYEEARKYFSSAYEDGEIENMRAYDEGHISWRPNYLKYIIEKYSK